MKRTKSTGIYRKLLRDAWRLTWERKSLWIFGIFAIILTSGGVLEVAFRSFRRIQSGSELYESILSGSLPGYEIFGQYIRQAQFLDETRVALTIAFVTLFFVLLFILSIISQGGLIIGASEKKELPLSEMTKRGSKHFFEIIGLNVLSKLVNFLLIALTTLPLILFVTRATFFDAVLYTLLFFVFFPLILIVAIITMIALIDIVKQERALFDAIRHATILFARHWLITFELGLILFLIVFLAGIVLAATVIVLAIPYTILLMLALLTTTPFIFILVNILGVVVFATLLLVYAGATTTFQYAVWLQFYDKALKKTAAKTFFAKLERLRK